MWYDVNGDGVQDNGEPGIHSATVTVTWLGPDGLAGGGDDQTFQADHRRQRHLVLHLGNLPPGTIRYTATVNDGQPVSTD